MSREEIAKEHLAAAREVAEQKQVVLTLKRALRNAEEALVGAAAREAAAFSALENHVLWEG
jgi:hypothetical protein